MPSSALLNDGEPRAKIVSPDFKPPACNMASILYALLSRSEGSQRAQTRVLLRRNSALLTAPFETDTPFESAVTNGEPNGRYRV